MIYRLTDKKNNISVDIIGLNEEQESRIMQQLAPFIIECNDIPNKTIIIRKSLRNFNFLLDPSTLVVEYNHENYLFKVVRQATRDALFQPYLDDGFIKFHCSSVEKEGNVSIFIGSKKAGKTSTALGLCKFYDYSLMSGDLTLIKNNDVLYWSSAIGTRKVTSEILNIDHSENEVFSWQYPKYYIDKGFSFAFTGKLRNIVVPRYDFEITKPEFRSFNIKERQQIILDNIHYDEINKNNYWGVREQDESLIAEEVKKFNELYDAEMFQYTSSGLNKENIKILERRLRR